MEDSGVNVSLKKIKWFIIGIVIVIGIFVGFRMYLINTNTNKFYECMKNLDIPLDNDMRGESGNGKIVYNTSIDKYLLEKNTYEENDGTYINNILYYNINDNTIDSSLSVRNKKGLYSIYGKYNRNNKKYTCNTIQNPGFGSKCNELKKLSESFSKEITKITKSCKINTKYVKL